ncbi:MAG: methyltransferase family protein [Planctomycetota bacterium]|jgi:protein-S-isoprenylcysteine O-methyltransferase Ste14
MAKETGRNVPRRIGEWALKLLGAFVILEPIWMLLPFAGFLYGSVFHIQVLNRNESTAWLTHFVFPVLTLGWLGPVLVGLGALLFAAGAAQIYLAKIRRSGIVTGGLYRFVRHPQYISLTLFGLGILLTWGRTITFIAFFFMMFLYYYLAKSEESACLRLFGAEYERYRERTSFIFPGDSALRGLGAKLPLGRLPAPVRILGALVLAVVVCFGAILSITAVKRAVMKVPHLTAQVRFETEAGREKADLPEVTSDTAGGVPFVRAGRLVVVRGPYRNAAAPGFAERLLVRLPASRKLKSFLSFLEGNAGDTAYVFCLPYTMPEGKGRPGMHAGEGRKGPPPDPDGPDKIRVMILRCSLAEGAEAGDAFTDSAKRRIKRACRAKIDLGKPEGEDVFDGDLLLPGPRFPGENVWGGFLDQLAEREKVTERRAQPAAVPGRFAEATLVLVKAPILRTRLDPPFAQAILDRLSGSKTFRDRLYKSGVGGDIVALAFPRPGPNWYSEHHGKPQVSLFVMLARRKGGGVSPDALFEVENRDLLGAFTAEMDFGVEETEDSVGGISAIGPRRDLEERWRFFLSGL